MSKKRQKRRVLEFGEYQSADGRYEYLGKPKYLYSWRLVESDLTPQGKKKKPALRTLKKQLGKDLADYIDINSAENYLR